MIRKTITLFSLSLIILSACKNSIVAPDKGKDLNLTPTEQQKVTADNAFTLKLFKATLTGNPDDQNLFLSPLSVSMAFGMTSNGAAGQTLHDIRNSMNFNNFTEDQVNSYYHKMITELPQLDPNTSLKIANSIWYTNSFTPLPAFLQVNTTSYNARVQSADFNSPATKDAINGWVNTATNGKIPTIIDNIPINMVMYLINAIYFKSSWASKFDASKTQRANFYLKSGGTVQADMMNNSEASFNTVAADDARVIELPYSNNKFSMVLLMPIGKPVKDYAVTLDSAKWQTLMAGLTHTKGIVALPKFKFSYDILMNDVLKSLGMAVAFSPDNADFTRINAAGHLAITEVKHKAYVEVNEVGSEAAAVTSIGITVTSINPNYYKFDHPFIFAIREMKTGLVLFTGVVNDPTK